MVLVIMGTRLHTKAQVGKYVDYKLNIEGKILVWFFMEMLRMICHLGMEMIKHSGG